MAIGSEISSVFCAAATRMLRPAFSQYCLADEVAVFVSQYDESFTSSRPSALWEAPPSRPPAVWAFAVYRIFSRVMMAPSCDGPDVTVPMRRSAVAFPSSLMARAGARQRCPHHHLGAFLHLGSYASAFFF
jgi:hypothetical protein